MTLFNNRNAVITGGASGIGEALAVGLAARGARVAIADISHERALASADLIGNGARGYLCDVTDQASLEALAAAVQRDFGGVNFVFANAGVATPGKLTETDPREFAWMFDVNVMGVFNTIQAFLPLLLAQAELGAPARFIATGSDNSFGITPAVCTAYTATKHAVLALMEGLRRDMDGSGVGMSILCPGVVNTRIWDGRSTRQDRYGGPEVASTEFAEKASKSMVEIGQDPALTARLCLDGVENGDFLIVADPAIRAVAAKRQDEVHAASDILDRRLEKA